MKIKRGACLGTSSLPNGFCDILGAKSRTEVLLVLETLSDQEIAEPVDLHICTEILNLIDSELALIVESFKLFSLIPPEPKQSDSRASIESIPAATQSDISDAKKVLAFTAHLLQNSYNKEVYNSAEYVMMFLKSYNDDLAVLALKVMASLACPPMIHKCLEENRHETAIHKNTALCNPFFEIVESALKCSLQASSEDILHDDFVLPMRRRSVHFDYRDVSFTSTIPCTNSGTVGERTVVEYESAGFSMGEDSSLVCIVDDVSNPSGDFGVLFSSVESTMKESSMKVLLNSAKFGLIWQIRLLRMLLSKEGRRLFLECVFHAVHTLLCCYLDGTLLSQFFLDKPDFVKDFLCLLRTGPGSVGFTPGIVPIYLRQLACQCLSAIVGSRDSTNVSVLGGRFSWLQHDLGVNRGQYMGLLPCVLRSVLSFLLLEDGDADTHTTATASGTTTSEFCGIDLASHMEVDTTVTQQGGKAELQQYMESLLWTESVLGLTMALISVTTALPALTDNGVISSIASVLSNKPRSQMYYATRFGGSDVSKNDLKRVSVARVHIDSLVVQILDTAITNHSGAFVAFKDQGGAEAALVRLLDELQIMSDPVSTDSSLQSIAEETAAQVQASMETDAMMVVDTHEITPPPPALQESKSETELDSAAISIPSSEEGSSEGSEEKASPVPAPVALTIISSEARTAVTEGQGWRIRSVPPASTVLIHQLLSLIISWVQDTQQDSGDHLHGQLLKGPLFARIFGVLFSNAAVLSSALMSQTVVLLSDIVNNDPAPPGMLGHMLSSGIADLALRSCLDPLLLYSSELLMGVSCLTSACCLMQEGIDMVMRINPFEHLFSLLLDEKYYYPYSKIFMTEVPNHFGVSLEDLIRHYPTLQNLCLSALLSKLSDVAELASSAKVICGPQNEPIPQLVLHSSSEGTEQPPVRMISALNRAYAVLACLEPLLQRKDTVTEMVDNAEVTGLINLLRAGLGTPRFLLTSLVCSIDSTPHSIGDCPVITAISRCFGHIAEVEPEKIMVIILQALSASITDVQKRLEEYWTMYGDAAASSIALDLHLQGHDRPAPPDTFKLHRFLDTISRRPLQDICPEELSEDLTAFADVLKSIAVVDYLTSSLASVIQPAGGKALSEACIKVLSTPENVATIRLLVDGIYVGCQREMARAKGCFADVKKADKVKNHPVYKLLVISMDSIIVKESADENSKRVCKIERGAVVDAYERVFSTTNMMRYRVDDGWVSHFRNASSSEPQIQVVDVTCKSAEMLEIETAAAAALSSDNNKSSDLEKFANISPRRGGFMSLFHLLTSTRYLLSNIVRTFVTTSAGRLALCESGKAVISVHTPHYLPMVHQCMQSIVPQLSVSTNAETAMEARPITKTTSGSEKEGENERDVTDADDEDIDPSFFVSGVVPSITDLGPEEMYLIINSAELCSALLFDDRRGRQEVNSLLFSHVLYRGDLLERVISATSTVFFCALELEPDCAISPPIGIAALLDTGAGVAAEEEHEDDESMSAEERSVLFAKRGRRKALKERRLLAVSSIDGIIDFWKQILTVSGLTPSNSERSLQGFVDEEHDFDPYAFKRRTIAILMRYLPAMWSHEAVSTLPPSTVRNLLDLMQVSLKSLQDSKFFPLQSAVSERDRLRTISEAATLALNSSRASARASRRALTAVGASDGVQSSFRVNESSVSILTDMGFLAEDIRRLASTLRTNSISILTTHLLEVSSLPPVTSSAISGTSLDSGAEEVLRAEQTGSSTAEATAVAENAATTAETNSDATLIATAIADADDTAPIALDAEPSMNIQDTTEQLPIAVPEGVEGVSSETKLIDFLFTVAKPLPLIPRLPSEKMLRGKTVLQQILQKVLSMVPSSCLRLIERGIVRSGGEWGIEVSSANQGVTREVTTVMVLNQMMRCLERQSWSEGLMKTVQLTWLYEHAIGILKAPSTVTDNASSLMSKWSRLYGILHAILLLLAGRVASAQHPRNHLAGNEMSFLIFSRAPQFTELYDLLIPALEKFAAVELPIPAPLSPSIPTSTPAPMGSSNGVAEKSAEPVWSDVIADPEPAVEMRISEETCDDKTDAPTLTSSQNNDALMCDASGVASERLWMGPAVLILDLMTQSLLVDKTALKVALEELEKMSHMQQLFSGNTARSSQKLSDPVIDSQSSDSLNVVRRKFGVSSSSTRSLSVSQNRSSYQSDYAVSLDFIQELKDEFLDKKDSVVSYKRKRKLAAVDLDDTDDTSGEDVRNPYGMRGKFAFHASYIASKKANSAAGEDIDGGVGSNDIAMTDSLLPLAVCGLSAAKKERCADICLRLLRQYSDYKHKIDAQTTLRAMHNEKAAPTPSPATPALPTPIPIDSSLPQAAVQLLVHVTRDRDVRMHFERSGGVHALISTIPPFEGMPNLLFTVLQHVLEDPTLLAASMESTVKMCWLRLSKLKTNKVAFKHLIEILAPLIHRDQQTFVQVMRTNIRLFRSEGLLCTALKEPVQQTEAEKEGEKAKEGEDAGLKKPSSALDAKQTTAGGNVELKVDESTGELNIRKAGEGITTSDAKKADEIVPVMETEGERSHVSTPKVSTSASISTSSNLASTKRQKTAGNNFTALPSASSSNALSSNSIAAGIRTPVRSSMKERRRKSLETGTPNCVPVPVTGAQSVIEDLLGLAVSQWARYQAAVNYCTHTYGAADQGNLHTGVTDDSQSHTLSLPSAPCHLTIAEIMLVVGDLVSIVPGLATCVHRYHIGKPNVAVAPVGVSISSTSIPATSFVTSTHASADLKALEKSLCLPTRHVLTGQALPSTLFLPFLVHRLVIPNTATRFELPDSASPETIEEAKMLQLIAKCTSGARYDEAASYLLAALASRPGDGRRRTIEELISALRVTCQLDTAQQLKCATQAAKVIQQFITPPADWAARETFFVPSRDLLQAFSQLNAHKVLDAAIWAVSTAHPLALEATIKMCEPLETIIRKGLPLVKAKGITPPDVGTPTDIPSGKQDIAAESGASVLGVEDKETVTADSSKATDKDNAVTSSEPPSVSSIAVGAAVGKVDGTSTWEMTPPQDVPILGSPLRERGDTIDSHDSGSALRGVGAELEHLSEDPHHLMIGADQRMTNGDSSDEHDSDDGDEHDSDEDDDEEEDDEEDDDDLEEDDDDDEEDQDSEDYEHDRDDVHFEDGVSSGGGRASFNFNVEGVNVSGRLSPRGCPDDEDDDDHEHDRMDDDAGEEEDEDEDADNILNINDDDDEIMDDMFEMADDDEDHGEEDEEEEDEDGEIMGAVGEDDEFNDLEEDDDAAMGGAHAMAGGRGVVDLEDQEGEEEGDADGEGAEELEEEDYTDAESRFPPGLARLLPTESFGRSANLGAHLIRLQQQFHLQGGALNRQQLMGITAMRGGYGADLVENDDGALQMRVNGYDGEPVRIEVVNITGGRDGRSRGRTHVTSGDDRTQSQMRNFITEMMPGSMIATSNMGGVSRGGSNPVYPFSRMGRPHATPALPATGIGASLPFPVTHPLLKVSDPGQARQLQNAGSGRSGSSSTSGGIFGAIFTAIRERGNQGYDDVRQARLSVSTRRRALGPLVSDRRWGTDIGEVEIVGSRMPTLLANVGTALGDNPEQSKEKEKEKERLAAATHPFLARRVTSAVDEEQEMDIMYEEQPGGSGDDHDDDDGDDDENEDEDEEADDAGDRDEEQRDREAEEEECKEEGELEETKECDTSDAVGRGGDSSTSSTTVFPATAATSSSSSSSSLEAVPVPVPSNSYANSIINQILAATHVVDDDTSDDSAIGHDASAPAAVTTQSEAVTDAAAALTVDIPVHTSDSDVTPEQLFATPISLYSDSTSEAPLPAVPADVIPPAVHSTAPVVKTGTFPGVSDEVWAALPFEMQTELLVSVGMQAEADALLDAEITATGLDRDVYFSLPQQLRQEVLHVEVTERRRRASFDESSTLPSAPIPASTDALPVDQDGRALASQSSSVTSSSTALPAQSIPIMNLSFDSVFASAGLIPGVTLNQLQAQTQQALASPVASGVPPSLSAVGLAVAAVAAPASDEGSENARFLASLSFDLRQDVLLSADPAFLLSLPASAQAEARLMRNAHAGRSNILHSFMERDGSEIARGRPVGESRRALDEFSIPVEPIGYAEMRRQSRERTALGMLEAQGRGGGVLENIIPLAAPVCVATTLFLTDDRDARGNDLPFSAAMIVRLFGCMLGVTKVRGPRPLLRLLATTCRYRSCRPWVLRALVSVLTKDSNLFLHSMSMIIAVQREGVDSSAPFDNSIHLEVVMLGKRIRDSATALTDLSANAVELRRFLSLLSYAMKKTDKLVWFDLLVRPEFSAYRIVGSVSMRCTDLNRQEEREKQGEKWLFGSLLGLLSDPATLNSSPALDTALHVIEIMCEPLSRLSVDEANVLASYQTHRWVKKAVVMDTAAPAPLCEKGHTMQVSGYAGDGYDGGFHCDNCVQYREEGERWLCLTCSCDICFQCFPAPLPSVPVVADAAAEASSSSGSSDELADAPVSTEDLNSGPRTKKARKSTVSESTTSLPETSAAAVDTNATSSSAPSSSSSSSSSSSVLSEATIIANEEQSLLSTVSNPPAGIQLEEQGVDIPFPILGPIECQILADLSGSEACGGGMGKRLMRILRPLALHDKNWYQMLQALSFVGRKLAKSALEEVLAVRDILSSVVQQRGNAQSAMSLPQLSTPRSVSELRLLQVLRLMTVLRSKQTSGSPAAAAAAAAARAGAVTDLSGNSLSSSAKPLRAGADATESCKEVEVVTSMVKQINFGDLWVMLCECLDLVRDLEGIVDVAPDTEPPSSSSSSSSSSAMKRGRAERLERQRLSSSELTRPRPTGSSIASSTLARARSRATRGAESDARDNDGEGEEDGMELSLSALTMRFMPLIECFLTVCGTTSLRVPTPAKEVSEEHSSSSSSSASMLSPSSSSARGSDSSALGKRKASEIKGTVDTAGADRETETEPPTAAPVELTEYQKLEVLREADAAAISLAVRTLSDTVPGARFRNNPGYLLMQLEMDETSPAAPLLLRFADRNRILLNMVLRNNVHLLESSFSALVTVPRCRHLLHFDIRRAFFKMKLKRMRQSSARIMHGSHRISVRRQFVFDDSFIAFRNKGADDMRRRLSVTFAGEEGMDAGGLTREWYSVLAREIFNANYALFTATSDSVTFQPNAQSYIVADHLDYFKFVGRVIGKAICDGQLLDAHFTRSFYKHILGQPVSYHDLEGIEPEYYKSLKQILTMPLELLGLDDSMTFSAESNDFGHVETKDLVVNGRNIYVTDENKLEYVRLVAHHRMTTAIRKQIDFFLEGFHELVPPELISLFDAQELELLISGLPDIDLDDLRAHTEYHGYKSSDPPINFFWTVLRSFSKEEKALFLQFVTGTSKVPLEGFKALQGAEGVKRFNIHKAYGTHLLPSAHTCFNQLDLPEYLTEDALKEKLLIAIREGSEGFGFA